jgi:uncharacterized protein (DUF1499 family)
MKLLLVLAVLLVAGPLLAGQAGWLAGTMPSDLGVRDGRLKPPSLTRNSVSSQAALYPEHPQRDTAHVAPLNWLPEGPEASMAALLQVLQTTPGVTIVQQDASYIQATARTRWLGFVDDVEFWFDPQTQTIAVRSASRIGREDFGANRQRVEAIRQRYLERR